jgi:3-dehydro-4-phosphotetronate decarboxylase
MALILEQLCELGSSLYDRGYAFAATGNISLRHEGKIWITPTGKSLKGLTPDQLAAIDESGSPLNNNRPSKEYPFHLAAYTNRRDVSAVVHLHSPYSVAVSCLDQLDEKEPLPAITPYYIMRVAPLGIIPYFRPGSPDLGEAVGKASISHNCMLLRNHGSICLGSTLNEAADRTEELEQTARLFFILKDEKVRILKREEITELENTFRK